jgi:hypothetical protein
MTVTDFVYFIDKPLFKYRWHSQNQQANQMDTDVLKYWFDEYRNCFEIQDNMLVKACLKREDVIRFYCDQIVKYAAADIMSNKINSAKRLLSWGKACYPKQFISHRFFKILTVLINSGRFGVFLLRQFYQRNEVKSKTLIQIGTTS